MDPDHANISEEDAAASNTAKKKKKKTNRRGPTRLTIGKKGKNKIQKIELQFNSKGQPIGPSRPTTSTNYGRLARGMVPIHFQTWHKVPKTVKDKIWTTVQENYVTNRDYWRHHCLQQVGVAFRNFKYRLHRDFVLPNKNDIEKLRNPPSAYPSIELEHWRGFVMHRLSKKSEAYRVLAQESRKKNLYPHHLSRKGYAGLEEELQCEMGTSEPIERCTLWKVGRQNKEKQYTREAVREKAQRIDEVARMVDEGTLTIEGSRDVLTMALGTQEHSGRVRGLGNLVTPTAFFHAPRGFTQSSDPKMKELLMFCLSEIHRLGGQVPPISPSFSPTDERVGSNNIKSSAIRPTPNSQQISTNKGCHVADQMPPSVPGAPLDSVPTPDSQQISTNKGCHVADQMPPSVPGAPLDSTKLCRLALGSIDNVVADGTLYALIGSQETVHGVLLGENNARVTVDHVEKGHEHDLLPIPNPGMTTLEEAIAGFVAWPRRLIVLNFIEGGPFAQGKENERKKLDPICTKGGIFNKGKENERKKLDPISSKEPLMPNQEKEDFKLVISLFDKFVERVLKLHTDVMTVELPSDVFCSNSPFCTPMKEVPIPKSDLKYLINFEEIGTIQILLYMCALHNTVGELRLRKKFGFVSPVGVDGSSSKINAETLFYCLDTAQENQLFFCPFNIGFHWVLTIVDPWKRCAFYFDPLGSDTNKNVNNVLKDAFTMLNTSQKFRFSKKSKTNDVDIEVVTCPRQPGHFECGYYVMGYMKDIIYSYPRHPTETFATNRKYEIVHLDELRAELVNYIKDNVQWMAC